MDNETKLTEITLLLQKISTGQDTVIGRLLSIEKEQAGQAEQVGRIEEKVSHLIKDVTEQKKEFKEALMTKAGKEDVIRLSNELDKISDSMLAFVKSEALAQALKLQKEELKAMGLKAVAGVSVPIVIKILYDAIL